MKFCDAAEGYAKRIRQINFRILKLNCMRKVPPALEVRQMIADKLAVGKEKSDGGKFGRSQSTETLNTLLSTDAKG